MNDNELAAAIRDEHWPGEGGGCFFCEDGSGPWPCLSVAAADRLDLLTAEVERLRATLTEADMDDAPPQYGNEAATAWASGWNAARRAALGEGS